MDILQVLEGLAYVGFIAGAIFAVIELRSMSRDRKFELMLRSQELFCSRDFEEACVNAVKTDFEPGKISDVDAKTITDHLDYLAHMTRLKLVDFDFVTDMWDMEGMHEWMKPWILSWEKLTYKGRFENLEWMANEERKRRLAREQKAKAG